MLPTLFISHGGGPMPLQNHPKHRDLTQSLREVTTRAGIDSTKVKCIVVVTAHWESDKIKVSTAKKPEMIYDYSGFSPESYKYEYPAKGSPETANRIISLLKNAGLEVEADTTRGFDHGVFVPLMLAFPEANIPVVSVSLHSGLSEKLHIDFGKALEPLREDVLIIGSGMSYHNMRGFGPSNYSKSKIFSEYLINASVLSDREKHGDSSGAKEERLRRLSKWKSAKYAIECHPRSEHLMPLLVVAAAGGEKGKVIFDSRILNAQCNSFSFM